MVRLFHVSDVHFGPKHLPELAVAVRDFVAERRPDLVVVSGDLTQRAKPHQFRAARAWVDSLAAPAITVPGNHDVPLYRVWERIFDPLGAYRRHFSPELEPVHRRDGLLVVGVNTAHAWTLKDGLIRLRRLEKLGRLFAAVPETVVKVVVAHHHLIPPPTFGTQSVLRNAFEAIDVFSSAGVDLILSGHLHQAYIGNSEEFYPKGRPGIVILHSGTTTSSRGRGWEREKNTCNWIEIDDRSLAVTHLAWDRAARRFSERSRHWYPRQGR
jgi:3',5'-cyclic AMP phosphodiesterase CpdA